MSHAPSSVSWASFTVWLVVNAVNALQSAGFVSRVRTGSLAVNRTLGIAILVLAAPAAAALGGFLRAKADWRSWSGPAVFLGFCVLSAFVDYISPVSFRAPARPAILVPYLVLFFGAIALMGAPMFSIDRRLWVVTLVSSMGLVASMGLAMRAGVA